MQCEEQLFISQPSSSRPKEEIIALNISSYSNNNEDDEKGALQTDMFLKRTCKGINNIVNNKSMHLSFKLEKF